MVNNVNERGSLLILPIYHRIAYVSGKQPRGIWLNHYSDVKLGAIASQITSLRIVYSTVYLGTDQRTYQSTASLTFVRGIHRWPVNIPRKWPVTQKMLPFDDVIMHREPTTELQETKQNIPICIWQACCKLTRTLWHHHIYTISPLQALGEATQKWTGDSPHKGTVCWALFSLCCWPEHTLEYTIKLPVILDAMTLIWRHCDGYHKLQFPP